MWLRVILWVPITLSAFSSPDTLLRTISDKNAVIEWIEDCGAKQAALRMPLALFARESFDDQCYVMLQLTANYHTNKSVIGTPMGTAGHDAKREA